MDINVMVEVVMGKKYVADPLTIATTAGLSGEPDRFINSIVAKNGWEISPVLKSVKANPASRM